MEPAIAKIKCPRCKKVLRPPFRICHNEHLVCPYCNQHQDNITGGPEDTNCSAKIFPMPVLNKLFRHIEDDCQYGCGFHGKLLKVENHEESCIAHDKLVKCAMPSCTWFNVISKLESHFKECPHRNTIHEFDSEMNTYFEFKEEVSMIKWTMNYAENHEYIELYWVRFYQHNGERYMMLMYLGKTSTDFEKEYNSTTEFQISSVNNPKMVVEDEAFNYSGKLEENINDTDFMLQRGVKITALEGNEYRITLKNISKRINWKSLLKHFECRICKQLMSNALKLCTKGHSICERCVKRFEKCSQCDGEITHVRNYAMESIMKKVQSLTEHTEVKRSAIICKYQVHGCNAVGTFYEMAKHERNCPFLSVKCILSFCRWKGPNNLVCSHWTDEHYEMIKENGTSISDANPVYLFHFSGEIFIVVCTYKRDCDNGEADSFTVHHVTSTFTTDFKYKLLTVNTDIGRFKTLEGSCLASSAHELRKVTRNIVKTERKHHRKTTVTIIRSDQR